MSLTGIINAIYSFCQNAMQIMGYPGLALVMFLENVFPPIPSEIVLPVAGTLTVSADPNIAPKFNIVSVIIWGTVGTFAGAWLWYWVGYLIGENNVRKLLRKVGKYIRITENDLDISKRWFEKYGEWCVFFGRMIPIIRTLISVPAGLAKMHWLKFSIFTLIGTTLWNTFLAFAGRILGDNYTIIVDFIDKFKVVIVVVCVVAFAIFFFNRVRKEKQQKAAAPEASAAQDNQETKED